MIHVDIRQTSLNNYTRKTMLPFETRDFMLTSPDITLLSTTTSDACKVKFPSTNKLNSPAGISMESTSNVQRSPERALMLSWTVLNTINLT